MSFNHGNSTFNLILPKKINPKKDNGVKVTEPLGEMLVPEWESIATRLTNAVDLDAEISKVIEENKIDENSDGLVVLGRDTRPSSQVINESNFKRIRHEYIL